MDASREVIARAAVASRTEAIDIFQTPSEKGKAFFVPQMELVIDGELRLFDEPEAIDYPWELPIYQAPVAAKEIRTRLAAPEARDGGLIDVDEDQGRLKTKFMLRNLLERQVSDLRKEAVATACAGFLFGEGNAQRVRVGSEYQFEFHPDAYAPDFDDDGECAFVMVKDKRWERIAEKIGG